MPVTYGVLLMVGVRRCVVWDGVVQGSFAVLWIPKSYRQCCNRWRWAAALTALTNIVCICFRIGGKRKKPVASTCLAKTKHNGMIYSTYKP